MAGGTNRRINIFVNGKEVEDKIGGVQAAFSRLTREIKQCSVGTDEYNNKAADIKKLKAVIAEHNVAIGQTASSWEKLKTNIVSTGVGVLAGNILTSLTTAAAGFFSGLIDGASKLSDQFADIRKTTGMTEQEVQLLNKGLKNIDTRTAVSELRNIAIVAGQLGIEKDKVLGFADSVDKINVALGDEISGGAEVVASTVGKLRNVLIDMKSDAPDQDLLKIGNALNELGAAGFATAPVVADFTNRIGGIAIPLGFTSAQVMGLGATMQELNINVERGGTAMGRILKKMTTETTTFANVAGMDVKSFTKMVNTDLYGAFLKVVEGSRRGGNSATSLASIIKELEVDGAGASEVFMKLSGNIGMANEKVALAAKSLQSTDSVMNEFNLKNNNFAGVMAKSGKDILGFFMGIGQKVSPLIASLVVGFADFTKWLKRNGESILFLSKIVAVAAISYISYSTAAKLAAYWTNRNTETGILSTIVTKAKAVAETASIAVTQLLAAAQMLLTGNVVGATQAMRVFNATLSTSGIGLVVGVISAAAAAYMMFKSKTIEASEAQQKIKTAVIDATHPIMQEQAEVNLLVKGILTLNEGSAERTKLLDTLAKNYPDFLGKLNKENVTNSQLAEQLLKVNDLYKEKIMLAATAAERDEIMKTAIANERTRMEAEKALAEVKANAMANGDPLTGKIYDAQIAKLQLVLTLTSAVAKTTEDKIKSLDKISNDIMSKFTVKPEDTTNGGGDITAGDTSDKKGLESFNKEMEKLREERLQAYLEADEKELRQVDVKYTELLNKAKAHLKEVADSKTMSDAEKLAETKLTNDAMIELDNLWSDELILVHRNQFAKTSELQNKESELYIAQLAKDQQDELKMLETTLEQSGEVKRNAIQKEYLDGIISKKIYDDKIAQLEIAQLVLLIDLRKKKNISVTDLESQLIDKFVAVASEKDKNTKTSNFFDKLFNTDKAKEIIQAVTDMVGEISNIWGSALQMQNNNEQTEFNKFKKSQDDKKLALDKRLKSGLISQQKYDEQIKVIDEETEKRQRQMAYDQAVREKSFATFNAVINTIQGVTKALSAAPPPFNFILAALTAAAGAVQIAAIQSQPLPELAVGGYTNGKSIVGEAGTEWIASNTLLKDKKTAPVISWLEAYQRGNKNATMPAVPNFQGMQNAVNNRYNTTQTAQNIVVVNTEKQEKLLIEMINQQKLNIGEIRILNSYLSDPNNRKARIVRDELTRFDNELTTLQGLARIG
ncbi:MAG: phage tail tape measure protein [Bacteroidota bacterium]